MPVTVTDTMPPEVAQLLNAPRAKRMDASELPADWLTPCMPTAVATLATINGKSVRRWQPMVLISRGAHDYARPLWYARELYADRDEALEVASLKADRLAVADYLESQGNASLPPTG